MFDDPRFKAATWRADATTIWFGCWSLVVSAVTGTIAFGEGHGVAVSILIAVAALPFMVSVVWALRLPTTRRATVAAVGTGAKPTRSWSTSWVWRPEAGPVSWLAYGAATAASAGPGAAGRPVGPRRLRLATLRRRRSTTSSREHLAEPDVGEPRPAAPHDGVSGRRVAVAAEVTAEPGHLSQVDAQRLRRTSAVAGGSAGSGLVGDGGVERGDLVRRERDAGGCGGS